MMTIDCELRVFHPAARNINYARSCEPLVTKRIYEHEGFRFVKGQLSAASHLKNMRENGLDFALISGLGWQNPEIRLENNRYVRWCVRRYPRKFRGFFVIDSRDVRSALVEIDSLDTSVFVGVEIMNNYSGGKIDDPRIQPILDAIREKNLILKLYAAHPIQTIDGDSAYRILAMIRRNPELKILVGHLGGLLCLYGLLPEVRQELKNVFFITSVSSTMKMVEFAASVNPDNLVFGSDAPFNHCFSQRSPLNSLGELNLTRKIKSKILSYNARHLIEI